MKLSAIVYPSAVAGLVAGTFALSSCTVEEPSRRPVTKSCTMEYDPVCARRPGSTELRTFPNACLARLERYEVIYRGVCREGLPPPTPMSQPVVRPAG